MSTATKHIFSLSGVGWERDQYGRFYLAQAQHIRALRGAKTKQIMMSETIPDLTHQQAITFKTLHFKRTSNSAQFPGLNLHQQQGRNLSRKVTTTPHPDVPGTSIAQVGAHQAVETKKATLDMRMAGKTVLDAANARAQVTRSTAGSSKQFPGHTINQQQGFNHERTMTSKLHPNFRRRSHPSRGYRPKGQRSCEGSPRVFHTCLRESTHVIISLSLIASIATLVFSDAETCKARRNLVKSQCAICSIESINFRITLFFVLSTN